MPGFSDIIGHEQIISNLRNAARTDQISHAYIFDGPEDSGKRMLAEAFAMLLLCESSIEGEPCLECLSCRQALGKNHPDILYVTHEKAGISVDDVRRQIARDVEIRPYRSRYKIYIVDEAEKMNVQAQNALLKTLEEPPEYVVILLLTTNAQNFLPTVLSRCILLHLKAVDDERIRQHLMQKCRVPDYRADLCVAFAQGNVGRAEALASSEQVVAQKDFTFGLIRKLEGLPSYKLMREVETFADHREDIPLFLDLLLFLFRDVLLYKSTADTGHLIFRDQLSVIQQMADSISFDGLNRIFQAIDTGNARIRMNVSTMLCLELLLLDIKENIE